MRGSLNDTDTLDTLAVLSGLSLSDGWTLFREYLSGLGAGLPLCTTLGGVIVRMRVLSLAIFVGGVMTRFGMAGLGALAGWGAFAQEVLAGMAPSLIALKSGAFCE